MSLSRFLILVASLSFSGLSTQATTQTPPAQTYYGPGIQFDVLDNAQVAEVDVDYRFRAAFGGALVSFKWYDVYKGWGHSETGCDGYGCGTGGSLDICLYPDDGSAKHLWAGKPLACLTDNKLRTGDTLRTESFPVAPVLNAGTLYHLHFHNTDPNPARNFVSVDNICVWHPTVPRQPMVPDTDLAVLSGEKTIETDTPIFQLKYANGAIQGQGYKEAWSNKSERISGPAMVRETFTVSGSDRLVTAVSFRISHSAGAGPLLVTLASGTGSTLEKGEIPAANFPLTRAFSDVAGATKDITLAWGTYRFRLPHTLRAGQSYQVILSAPADTTFHVYGIQRASGYGFAKGTFFGDGYGQFSHDSGSTWFGFSQSNESVNHNDADLQFYFTTK